LTTFAFQIYQTIRLKANIHKTMSILKKLASQTAIYGISSNLGRLLNYVLVPLHTTVFLPEQYGIISDFYAKAAFFNVIYTFGMETAYFRFSSKTENNKQEVYNLILWLLILTGLVFSTVLTIFSTPLANLMNYPDNFGKYIIILAWLFAADSLVTIPFARMRQENKAKLFATLRILSIVTNVSINFFFLWFCKNYIPTWYDENLGIAYVFMANLIGNLIVIPFLWRYFTNISLKMETISKFLKPILLYAYPILFMSFAAMINEVISRDFIKYYLPVGFYEGRSNLEAVGIFSACYKFSIFITLAVQAFKYAAEPFFFAKATEKDSPQVFAHISRYFVIAAVCMYAGVSLNLDLLQHFLLGKPEYAEGLAIVPILLLANLFLGVYYNLSVWFKVTDKTYFGTLIGFIGAAITILGNLALIPFLGYVGSALATLLCYFSMTALSYYFGQKHYPVPYNLKNAFSWIGFATLLIIISHYTKTDNFWLNQVLHISFTLFLVMVVIWREKGNVLKKV
jgi:O-antigen/teichoic acid export membrane protein